MEERIKVKTYFTKFIYMLIIYKKINKINIFYVFILFLIFWCFSYFVKMIIKLKQEDK